MQASEAPSRARRLHHHAFVVRDQEATRHFYETIVGLPLVATWCEEEDFGEGPMAYCHTFYELADGGCLAFFEFAEAADWERFRRTTTPSPFHHVALSASAATQDAILARAKEAGIFARVVDHGYCRSLYLPDPDGLLIEVTVDDPSAIADATAHREQAHAELARWKGGDRRSNNRYRRGA